MVIRNDKTKLLAMFGAVVFSVCSFFYALGGKDESQALQVIQNSDAINLLRKNKADRDEIIKAVNSLRENNKRLGEKTEKLAEIYVVLAEVKHGVVNNSKRTDRIESKLDELLIMRGSRVD